MSSFVRCDAPWKGSVFGVFPHLSGEGRGFFRVKSIGWVLMDGDVTGNWTQAFAQLAVAYPDRINPYLY